jgi:hypothetical protein
MLSLFSKIFEHVSGIQKNRSFLKPDPIQVVPGGTCPQAVTTVTSTSLFFFQFFTVMIIFRLKN